MRYHEALATILADLKRGLRLNSINHNYNLRSNTKKVEMFEKNRTQTRSGDKEFSSMVPHFLNMIFPHILDYNFKQLQSFIQIEDSMKL
jgi:hypothetical protein